MTTTVKRISFGFPQNIIVETTIDNIDDIKKNNYTNKNVDLRIKIDKTMKRSFNKESIENEIKLLTKANKLRIKFVYENQTNIRLKEIAELKDVVDKFVSYATLNGIQYKPTLLDKIRDIQDYMAVESFTPHDSFILEYISIRGAIGILDGQGKEDLSFNFADDFEPGIIGITGVTGAGKSTLLENMHPYPCMLTRQGSLKEHFCLTDSHRILVYRTSSGKKIRITMYINGSSKSVMTRYFVETKEVDKSWEPLRSIDGSNESYTNWVNATFGPKELFMRTSFYAKETPKNLPDLAQATKTEKMELFSILAGTDYLSTISEQAKFKAKELQKTIEEIKYEIKDFDDVEKKISDNKLLIESNNRKIDELTSFIEQDTKELDDYNEKQKLYITAAASYDIYRKQLSEYMFKKVDIDKKLLHTNNNIVGLKQQMEDIEHHKETLAWYDDALVKMKELKLQDSDTRDKLNSVQAVIDKKQREIDIHKDSLRDLEIKISDTVKDINMLEKSIPDVNGTCPVCGAPLSQHKKEELEKETEEIKNKIEVLKNERTKHQEKRDEEVNWIDENNIQNYKTEQNNLSKTLVDITNDISTLEGYMSDINIDELKNIINNSENNLHNEENIKAGYEAELKELNSKIKEYEDYLNNIPTDYSAKIEKLQRGITVSQQDIAQLKAEITMSNKNLEYYSEAEEKVRDIKSRIKEYQADVKEFEIIQQAFSNNGIQALELDSAAPEISDIANSILEETLGDRFKISFDTQRDSKNGRKIDDFVINVFDAKCGREKRLDWISSGEGALMKQTLYYAFSVIRTRRTGFCFKTRFLDESDGSLDSSLRVRYLRMIEAAHKQCGAVQSFLITHSQELKEIIDQKIEL